MNKHEKMYQQIRQHGENLLRIFPDATIKDPVKLSKRLFSLEHKAHKIALDWCNGTGGVDTSTIESHTAPILRSVHNLLQSPRVWFNGDARGYALKFNPLPEEAIHRDWGGNAIVAPDFREST